MSNDEERQMQQDRRGENLYWSNVDGAWRVSFTRHGRCVMRRFARREDAIVYRDTMRTFVMRAMALRDVRRLFGADAEGDTDVPQDAVELEADPESESAAKIGGVR